MYNDFHFVAVSGRSNSAIIIQSTVLHFDWSFFYVFLLTEDIKTKYYKTLGKKEEEK